MGAETEIAWCDSTFNPWIGCMKVSAGCDNCYAETMMDKRYHRVEWGQRRTADVAGSVGTRIRTSASNWKNPIIWNARARGFQATFGRRRRVFCSSLADVFDNQVPQEWQTDLFDLIKATPNLDWLLLTKRPENIRKVIQHSVGYLAGWPWSNVWLGTTCEDQAAYDKRWPILRDIPAAVRFISYEPAIGPLCILEHEEKPDWIICGGESGRGYREMKEVWAENVRADCIYHDIPFFMKQMAGKRPIPDRLMLREFPEKA